MTSQRPTSMERVLVGLALDMLNWIEASTEEQIELRTAVQFEENIATVLGELSMEDRELFISAATTLAEQRDQARPGGGHAILEALAALGLDEPE